MLRSPNQRANQIRRSYKNEEFDWLFDFVTVTWKNNPEIPGFPNTLADINAACLAAANALQVLGHLQSGFSSDISPRLTENQRRRSRNNSEAGQTQSTQLSQSGQSPQNISIYVFKIACDCPEKVSNIILKSFSIWSWVYPILIINSCSKPITLSRWNRVLSLYPDLASCAFKPWIWRKRRPKRI